MKFKLIILFLLFIKFCYADDFIMNQMTYQMTGDVIYRPISFDSNNKPKKENKNFREKDDCFDCSEKDLILALITLFILGITFFTMLLIAFFNF